MTDALCVQIFPSTTISLSVSEILTSSSEQEKGRGDWDARHAQGLRTCLLDNAWTQEEIRNSRMGRQAVCKESQHRNALSRFPPVRFYFVVNV
jgi:hypothetical protein